MSVALLETESRTGMAEIEFVTFCVGNILVGIDIRQAEEIHRHVEVTPVPHAPKSVRGVMNLRGEVATVIDLRTVFGLPSIQAAEQLRTVVVSYKDEKIGLIVDRIGDVIKTNPEAIDPPPANMDGLDRRLCKGVYKLDAELLVVLDIDAAFAVDSQST